MSHENLEQYIAPEFPKEQATDNSFGFAWQYIGPTQVLRDQKPRIGELWADGREVTSYELVPDLQNSTYGTLDVSTVTSVSGGGSGGSDGGSAQLVETRYSLRWTPNSVPLFSHPELKDMDDANKAACYGWEAELSEAIKSEYSYYPRDGDGNITGSPVVISNTSSAAYLYVWLRLRGHENYNFFSPNWTKTGIYVGSEPPNGGTLGQKTAVGDIPKAPSWADEWEWVKTDDSIEQIAGRNRWQRTETWSGAKTVFYDVDEIFV